MQITFYYPYMAPACYCIKVLLYIKLYRQREKIHLLSILGWDLFRLTRITSLSIYAHILLYIARVFLYRDVVLGGGWGRELLLWGEKM